MVDSSNNKDSHWWWFDSHKNTKHSPWLQSTIKELDERTKSILRIIEEDADSFAKRAEMFYNKKPQLIKIVEDFYRAHRSLAERYDLTKSDPITFPTPYPRVYCKSKSDKDLTVTITNNSELPCDSISISSISEDYTESEIDEAEQLDNKKDDSFVLRNVELEKLKDENRSLKIELEQKDEEKREVIRQLSMTISMLKEDNVNLRQRVVSASKDFRFNRSLKLRDSNI